MSAKFFLTVFLVILIRDNYTVAQISIDFVSRVTSVNNYIGYTGEPTEPYVRCMSECAQLCTQRKACRSFFYNRVDNLCQLQDVLFVNNYGLAHYYQTKYYKMKEVLTNFTCPTAPPDAIYNQVLLSDNTVFTYRIVWSPENKTSAEAACGADGALLARVLTVEKMQTLVNIFSTCPGFDVVNYWIDGSNENAVDFSNITQWTTSVGNPVPTTGEFWGQGKPKSPDIRHCINLGATVGYKWSDGDCSSLNYFVCEK